MAVSGVAVSSLPSAAAVAVELEFMVMVGAAEVELEVACEVWERSEPDRWSTADASAGEHGGGGAASTTLGAYDGGARLCACAGDAATPAAADSEAPSAAARVRAVPRWVKPQTPTPSGASVGLGGGCWGDDREARREDPTPRGVRTCCGK